jgi:hypothetical protein
LASTARQPRWKDSSRRAQRFGVHSLAPGVDPHTPGLAIVPVVEVEHGREAIGRVVVAARGLLERAEVLARRGRERLGDDVVARGEVVVEQPEAGPGLGGDRPHRRLGEAAPLDHSARGLDELGAPAVLARRARRGRQLAHAAGTGSAAAGADGTAASAASTRRCRAGRYAQTGSPCSS